MKLSEFLFDAVDSLRAGDQLLTEELLPILDQGRDQLEAWALEIESKPFPQGLEALGEGLLEAAECLADALDYLELAAIDNIPQLSEHIGEKTQDALDIMRDVRQRCDTHYQILSEEMITRG